MNKLLAVLFLLLVSFAVQLANFWYTFGLWPRSWVSFFVWSIASSVIVSLFRNVYLSKD